MKYQFNIYEPVKVWNQHRYEIEANSKEEAINKLKKIADKDDFGNEEDGWKCCNPTDDIAEFIKDCPVEIEDIETCETVQYHVPTFK